MRLLPQPRSDTPKPAPEPDTARRSSLRTLGNWIAALCLVLALAGLVRTHAPRRNHAKQKGEAIANARQVALALFAFDAKYGSFPDSNTAADVKAGTSTPLTLGDRSSNQLLRQLLAAGVADEQIFWARTSIWSRRPDNVFNSDTTALAPGECSFAYVLGASSPGNLERPVLTSPMIPGTNRFDPETFDDKAIVVRADLSVRAETIRPDGRVFINGMDLFDPRQPFWGGKAPDIKWPE
ncbi:hypothetical protein [Luteolibacter marinus]|uniref:hypothetical protein n=1 Tax=Luteolibacter marinus TaxID=2776705 RepID=UPI0018676531|nr:hypothetical protein [Luteolibacter marinus]